MSDITPKSLVEKLNKNPVEFSTVISVIDAYYDFTPTQFTNGNLLNEANSNNGSCKVFSFAIEHSLSKQATLNAFGDYYMIDVLQHPENDDHQNIRNFIEFGWEKIKFEGRALTLKK
ncbi:HopJ type III effector protein [Thiomicrorhabdus sp.]|uniref:HopJ type III effector protein n=1 Tax=Thiomicrorhabdus sp. TaxID=2039724 RepID=UPI002AA763A9|nr:HopJ type III effector protein [Thiomicrorhabdus sp.]